METQLYQQTAGIEGWMELTGRGLQQLHTSAPPNPALPGMRTLPTPGSNRWGEKEDSIPFPSRRGDVLCKAQGTSQHRYPSAHTLPLPPAPPQTQRH